MADRMKKAQCVAWLIKTKSDTQTQRNYRTTYGESPPSRSSIPLDWQGGPIAWPPRSPDLTPLDFFFWGYIKDTAYGTQVNSLEELKQNIQTAVATVDVSMLKRSWMELEYRLDIVRATKGSHVEIS
ncbi:transposable element Tcb1 transposase [Trichonephila clavipes]|uniref:Transposable element Tcb1 transposase n=1 Tax=Trichonephila clavipes TaxID=2585209 RepID=A0A8X6SEG4_TRICX|nr:transposable element Tcb1 transposase [Trichonephila clavipes]